MTDSPAGAMSGLTVRWSLAGLPESTLDELAAYVADSSHARFEQLAGLRFKTWRARPGEWFEGCYVFVDDAARAAFQEAFTLDAADSAGSKIVGAAPVLIQECSVIAVAEGPEKLASSGSVDR